MGLFEGISNKPDSLQVLEVNIEGAIHNIRLDLVELSSSRNAPIFNRKLNRPNFILHQQSAHLESAGYDEPQILCVLSAYLLKFYACPTRVLPPQIQYVEYTRTCASTGAMYVCVCTTNRATKSKQTLYHTSFQ